MPDHLPEDTLPADPRGSVADPQFPVALRGYDRRAVDAYVQRVSRMVDELTRSSSPREAVSHALAEIGEETSEILRSAHATADQVTSRAEAQAAELTARTQADAAELQARSEADARRRYADAEQRVKDLDRDADVLWQERRKLIDDIRGLADALEVVAREGEQRFPAEPEAEPEPEAVPAAETAIVPAPVRVAELDPDRTMEIPAAELPDATEATEAIDPTPTPPPPSSPS